MTLNSGRLSLIKLRRGKSQPASQPANKILRGGCCAAAESWRAGDAVRGDTDSREARTSIEKQATYAVHSIPYLAVAMATREASASASRSCTGKSDSRIGRSVHT